MSFRLKDTRQLSGFIQRNLPVSSTSEKLYVVPSLLSNEDVCCAFPAPSFLCDVDVHCTLLYIDIRSRIIQISVYLSVYLTIYLSIYPERYKYTDLQILNDTLYAACAPRRPRHTAAKSNQAKTAVSFDKLAPSQFTRTMRSLGVSSDVMTASP